MPTEIVMPQLGESVVEGTITKWLVREGDVVEREQPVVEVATDKADSEVPATESGKIVRIVAAEGQTVKVGETLCEIDVGAAQGTSAAGEGVVRARPSPAVRKLALERGVDVDAIEGSGERGRVMRADVHRAAEAQKPAPAAGVDPQIVAWLNSGALIPVPNVGFGAYKAAPYRSHPGDRVVPFDRRRRLTAGHMTYSKVTAPHVVTVAEVDLLHTSQLREAHKEQYKKEGAPLTMLAFVCHATVRALREYPIMNARVLEDAYVLLQDVNLGVAVDAPDGLVVPTIKEADELSLRGLAKAIDEVAQRARSGGITADDLANGSFAVSNPGIKGNLFGGAIIAQPNVGILRMGEIQKRVVVVVDVNGQDTIAIHPVMYLALSYDHRIVDGVLGNSFLYRVTEILEKGDFEV